MNPQTASNAGDWRWVMGGRLGGRVGERPAGGQPPAKMGARNLRRNAEREWAAGGDPRGPAKGTNPRGGSHRRALLGAEKRSPSAPLRAAPRWATKARWQVLFTMLLATLTVTPALAQQQTFSLETDLFRLVFNRFEVAGDGYATGLRELLYLPSGKRFPVHERPTFFANTETGNWSRPSAVEVQEEGQNNKLLTISFSGGRSIRVRVTSHPHFLEFTLLQVHGEVGELWLMGTIILGLQRENWPGWDPTIRNEYNQITYLGEGYYLVVLGANPHTYPARAWDSPSEVFVRVVSPAQLPLPPGLSFRDQRFAWFICREADLRRRVAEVEAYFGVPYGVALKERIGNNRDYLFLIDESFVDHEAILSLCRELGLSAVLLYQGFWSDWRDPSEPYKLQPWTEDLVARLKAAGLMVGLHAYVHLVPVGGYYATHHPTKVLKNCVVEVFHPMDWRSDLPQRVAEDFLTRVEALGPQWLYFDGNSPMADCGERFDAYLEARQNWAILGELWRRGYAELEVFQTPGGTVSYSLVSRLGQTDYWDGPGYKKPIEHMDFTAQQQRHRRRALYRYADLGWFGREIHTPGGRRDATWEEWRHLARVSLEENIPIGLRTTYADFVTDPLRSEITALIAATTAARQRLPRPPRPHLRSASGVPP